MGLRLPNNSLLGVDNKNISIDKYGCRSKCGWIILTSPAISGVLSTIRLSLRTLKVK